MLTASKAACPIAKPLTGVLIFKVGRIHTAGSIKELLGIHKVASIDGDTPHEEVPFSPSLRLGNGGQPSIQTLCVSCVEPLRRGAASNTNYFGMDLGYFLGPIVGGFVVDISGSYATMYYTAVIPLILGTVIFTIGWGKFKNYLK